MWGDCGMAAVMVELHGEGIQIRLPLGNFLVGARDDGSVSVNFFSVDDPGLSKKSLLSDKGNFYVQS